MNTIVFGEGLERVAVRPITPNIFWITHCLGDKAQDIYKNYFGMLPNAADYSGHRIVDYPFSAFLIRDEKSLMIDTGAPRQQANTLKAVEYVLGDKSLDYIWISHVELPHAGNAPALKRRYPQAQYMTVRGGEQYALHGLEGAQLMAPGEVINLGKHQLESVEPLFVDHGLSQWAYERTTGFTFTADWAHNLHEPAKNECFMFLDEMETAGYSAALHCDDVKVNAWYQFPWLKWTDPDEVCTAIDAFFARYNTKILAPSHGNIIRGDMARYVPLIKEGMRQAIAM